MAENTNEEHNPISIQPVNVSNELIPPADTETITSN